MHMPRLPLVRLARTPLVRLARTSVVRLARTPLVRLARTPLVKLAGLLLVSLLLSPGARAQAPTAPESGQFVIFDQSVPVAHERYRYQFMGDSLVVSAMTQRQFQDDKGQRHPFVKTMVLVVDARDLGLMRYLSNQDFHGHKAVRGLLPGDTVMTYYAEYDGVGSADRVVQPPGRLFVLDPQLFTLFDVLCRSLAGKQFEMRRVQLLALAPDTLTLGSRRVPTRRYALEDQGVRFELWADERGRMLRMANEPSGLSVERVPDPRPATAPRRRPARRH